MPKNLPQRRRGQEWKKVDDTSLSDKVCACFCMLESVYCIGMLNQITLSAAISTIFIQMKEVRMDKETLEKIKDRVTKEGLPEDRVQPLYVDESVKCG